MTTAIIGATGNLGRDIVRRIACRDAVLLGYFRNGTAAAELCAELQAQAYSARAAQVDIRDFESVSEFLRSADTAVSPLAAIISAEGAPFPVETVQQSAPGDLAERLTTDVVGSLNILKAAYPILRRNAGGCVILFTTACTTRTLEYDSMSSVPKSAVAMLIRQAAREMGGDNIRVNGVAPGVIDTGKIADRDRLPPLVRDMVDSCMRQTPLGRTGTTTEVAALCEYLTSPEAAYISGQVIAIDGGFSA